MPNQSRTYSPTKLWREARPNFVGTLLVIGVTTVVNYLRGFDPVAIAWTIPFLTLAVSLYVFRASSSRSQSPSTKSRSRFGASILGRQRAPLALAALSLTVLFGQLEAGDRVGERAVERVDVPPRAIFLLAPFDGPDLMKYRVTETMVSVIDTALQPYGDVRLKLLDSPLGIQDSAASAQRLMREHGASAIIWGWYGVTDTNVVASVHVDFLSREDEVETVCSAVPSDLRVSNRLDVDGFSFQMNIGEEVASVALFYSGFVKMALGDYEGAITRFSEVERLRAGKTIPVGEYTLYYLRAMARYHTGKDDLAVADLDIALARQMEPQALLARSVVNLKRGRVEDVIADTDRLLALDESLLFAWYVRGAALADNGRLIEARATADHLIAVAPTQGHGYELLGKVDFIQKNNDAVVGHMTTAIQNGMDTTCARTQRAWAFMELARYAEAARDYEVVRSSPDSRTEGLIGLGEVEYRAGRFDSALILLNLAISENPNVARGYSIRARVLQRLRRSVEAINDYDQVIRRSKEQPEIDDARVNVNALRKFIDKCVALRQSC